MSRKYPLDLPDDDHNGGRDLSTSPSRATRAAAGAADVLLEVREWRLRHQDFSQLFIGLTLIAIGVLLAAGAGITDNYLHRGVESGAAQPYIVQPTGKGLATNVDLRNVDAEQVEELAGVLSRGGFRYVRQEINWSDIEGTRGSFDWMQYDTMLGILDRNGLQVIAVVVDTPDWARSVGETGSENAPPRDLSMLATFAGELTSHFGDQISFVQLWDDPNLTDNWGGRAATGEDFSDLLRELYRGVRQGNVNARVVTPELALQSDAANGQGDLAFVADLYQSGGAAAFDVLGMRLDGGDNSPDDRRVSLTRPGFSRAILFRELMVDQGDPGSPVWATSYGWATGETITPEKQAEFVERGMERSWSEWPWMGLMVQWSLFAPAGSPDSSFAIITSQGTSTPLYARLTSRELTDRSRIANTGFAPMNAQSVTASGSWANQHLEGRTFRTTRQVGSSMSVEFQGTGLIAYVRSGPDVGQLQIEIDGEIVPGGSGDEGLLWDLSIFSVTQDFPRTLVSDLEDTQHTLTITLVDEGQLTLGGFEIIRDAPFVWPIVLMAVGALISLFFGLRSIAYLFATRAGHLRRPTDPESEPELPLLTNWRPDRRLG